MTELDFCEIVQVLDTPATRELGIPNTMGVVLCKAGEGEITSYAVLISDETYSLHHADLRRTRQKVDRQEIYDGERISVSLDGEILRLKLQETEPD